MPYNRFKVRVSYSTLPYGSTGPIPPNYRRRIIFPWYVAIDKTYKRSEVSASPT